MNQATMFMSWWTDNRNESDSKIRTWDLRACNLGACQLQYSIISPGQTHNIQLAKNFEIYCDKWKWIGKIWHYLKQKPITQWAVRRYSTEWLFIKFWKFPWQALAAEYCLQVEIRTTTRMFCWKCSKIFRVAIFMQHLWTAITEFTDNSFSYSPLILHLYMGTWNRWAKG